MTGDELRALCEACYGRAWQTSLAEALGVDISTVHRWATDRSGIKPAMVERIKLVLHDRVRAAAEALGGG